MRGGSYPELNTIISKAILMEVYNQQYSELDNMPIKDVLFFLNFFEAREIYKDQKMKQEQAKLKRRR